MSTREAFAVASAFILLAPASLAEERSYVDEVPKIIELSDPNREAQAWAMCAAAYELTAEIVRPSAPARANQLSELANGAELAVVISMVAPEINDDLTQEKFATVWRFSVKTGGEIPKTMKTALLADYEADQSARNSKFLGDLAKTVGVCMSNLEGQQQYIDVWRSLAKSGLLQMPEE
ncbi:MAG: hypothetical protein IPM37_03715 [Hahellaceae bacterium]|nr:hypothetical protein [Hahellaceae bacterium]